ncbi:MAG: 50S ribosomal protein L30 [Flavobacteriaceae bacterium]|nr:50S ribosomal protein L30 [Flavobacteriaceae bacterium]
MLLLLQNKEEFLLIKYLKDKNSRKMAKILVKQVRSRINCPETQKRTLDSLGLRKLGQVVEHDASPAVLGMVNKVKHLVSVEETK